MKIFKYFAALALGCLISNVSYGQGISFVFSQSSDGGVNVTGFGSGTVTDELSGVSDFDLSNFTSDFLSDSLPESQINVDAVTGSLTNVSTGFSSAIENFGVDRDPNTGDDLDFDTVSAVDFSIGDSFEFSLTASFDANTLSFSDLIPGTHIEPGGSEDEIFGQTTISAVPEPSSLFVLFTATLALAGRRMRRG